MSIDDLLKERKSEDEYPEELSEEEDDEDMVSGKFVANMSAKSDQGGNLLWTRWSDDMVYMCLAKQSSKMRMKISFGHFR